ncbi:MAG: ABC transporter substrate-binding protein [Crocinitomicaceae bacterium]
MRILFYVVIASLGFSSCSIDSKNPSSDSTDWEEVDLEYAEHFKLLRKGEQFSLVLLDPDSKEEVQTVNILAKSDQRIICLTATLTGMFCELDAREYLVGITAENQLYDATLKKRFSKGKMKEYGDFTQLSLERVADANPSVILYNYVNNEFPHKEKLEKLGIQLVTVNDWLEAHPLAKAEWIKVVGALSGKFDEACELFDKIKANYESIATDVQQFETQPSVISGNLIGGSWYAPSGENYFGILIQDAGGDYVYKESKGAKSLALPLEKILEDNQSTEIWLNPGVPSKKALLQLNPHSKLLQAQENGVYCYSGSTNKFWEQSALRADFVLEDLAHIFHPELGENYSFHYYAPLQP